jgi:hypothetical protein
MIEVSDFGRPYKDMLPDMFGEYPGCDTDTYLLAHSGLLYVVNNQLKAVVPEGVDGDERAQFCEMTRQRHNVLRYKTPHDPYTDLPEPDELMLKIKDIEDAWDELYLRPRLGPLDETLYGDWLAHCLDKGQELRLHHTASSWDYGHIALTDLTLSPMYARHYKILVPPSVSVDAPNGLGTTQLFTWSAERPLVDDNGNSSPILPVTGAIARRLLLELGVADERIAAIATKETP